MSVVPEDVLIDLLDRCIRLSLELIPALASQGTSPVPEPLARRYSEIVAALHRQKRHDSVLNDEAWEWIWDERPGISHLKLYGRLAWLNYNLLDLL